MENVSRSIMDGAESFACGLDEDDSDTYLIVEKFGFGDTTVTVFHRGSKYG